MVRIHLRLVNVTFLILICCYFSEMVTYMKVSNCKSSDLVHANSAQEVAKVVHL